MDFAEILQDIEKDLPEIEQRIFAALRTHPNGLRRGQLVAIAFGESVKAGPTTNNNSRDRAVRMAIHNLRLRMVPIVSSSGRAGYRLDISAEGRQRMLADLISRRDELNQVIERAAKFYSIPERMPVAETAQQAALL